MGKRTFSVIPANAGMTILDHLLQNSKVSRRDVIKRIQSHVLSVLLKVEIIPMQNPAKLRTGDFLDLKVLFDGKPAKYFNVYATYSGFSTDDDFAYATGTNAKGMTRIRLLHHGPWLVKADIKMPAPAELKDKCMQVHYTATLTFEVE